MPSAYTPDATNVAQPADTDYAYLQAAELRTLKAYLAAQLAGLGGPVNASVFKNRNRIINGNFDVWQRATSQTSSGYGSADRWFNQHSGSTKTASRQAFTLGQTDVPYEPTYYHRTVVTSVAGASNYVVQTQRIESVRSLAGQTATLTFWAKADAAKNIAFEVYQSFGTGGSPSAAVSAISAQLVALTTAWQQFTITVNVPSIAGKTLGTNGDDYLSINFWFDAGSSYNARASSLGQQSGTFDIAQVQLEVGGYATPFEYQSPAEVMAQCERYYQYHDFVYVTGYTLTTILAGQLFGNYTFPAMRDVPTPTIGTITASGTTGLTIDLVYKHSMRLITTVTSNTYGRTVAPVALSAEL